MVNISKTITHLAMNYLLMKIMWQIVMDPPFGKETYMFSFEVCRALFVCFTVIIALIECTKWMCTKEYTNIDKYLLCGSLSANRWCHISIHSRYWKHRYPLSYIPYLPSIFDM